MCDTVLQKVIRSIIILYYTYNNNNNIETHTESLCDTDDIIDFQSEKPIKLNGRV